MNFQSEVWILLLVVSTTIPLVYSYTCEDGTNYTSRDKYSPFRTNLGSALSLLESASSNSHYHNASVGSSPDRAHATFMCRYDLSLPTCHECVTSAVSDLKLYCPTYWSAAAQSADCAVQYTNHTNLMLDFYTQICDNPNFGDPLLMQLMVETMSGLIEKVASESGGGDIYFATGETTYMVYQKVHGLVQCSPESSVSSCRSCLQLSMESLLQWCGGQRIGATSVIGIACISKYSLYGFYNTSGTSSSLHPLPPRPPSDSITPANSQPSSSPGALGTAIGLAYILWRFCLW